MNHQNQMSNHPQEVCTTGKVLSKAKNAARYLGYAGSDATLPENSKAMGHTRWTQKVRLFIHSLLKTDGLLSVHEIESKTEQSEISFNIQ